MYILNPDDTPFRAAERFWKRAQDLSAAFDTNNIEWAERAGDDGRTRGTWRHAESGREVECWLVRLGDLSQSEMGQTRWKGKAREEDPHDFGIIVSLIPGEDPPRIPFKPS